MKIKKRARKHFMIFMLLMVLVMQSNMNVIHASEIAKIDDFNDLDGDSKYLGDDYYDNYYLDIEKTGILDAGDKMGNNIANTLFSMIKILGKLMCSIFYYAIEFDINDILGDQIDVIQKSMKASIFTPLFNLGFAGTAFIIIKRMIKRDTAAIVTEIAKVVLIVTFSILIVNKSSVALSSATSITKGISTDILTNMNSTYGVSGKSGTTYAAESAGVLWVSLIHEPWKSLEFGSSEPETDDIEDFLSAKPGSDERKDLVKDYDNSCFDKGNGWVRIGMLIVYLIPFGIKSLIYMAVAGIQIVFQLLAVFFVILAPIILILAMFPGYEMLIPGWLKKILETQISILVITLMMALMIKVDTEFYSLIPTYGWLAGIILQTILSIGLFFGRNKILNMFASVQRSMGNPRQMQMRMRHMGNPYKGIQNAQNVARQLQTKVNKQNTIQVSDGDKVQFERPDSRKNRPVIQSKNFVTNTSNLVNTDNKPMVDSDSTRPTTANRPVYVATPNSSNKIDTSDYHTMWENGMTKAEYQQQQKRETPAAIQPAQANRNRPTMRVQNKSHAQIQSAGNVKPRNMDKRPVSYQSVHSPKEQPINSISPKASTVNLGQDNNIPAQTEIANRPESAIKRPKTTSGNKTSGANSKRANAKSNGIQNVKQQSAQIPGNDTNEKVDSSNHKVSGNTAHVPRENTAEKVKAVNEKKKGAARPKTKEKNGTDKIKKNLSAKKLSGNTVKSAVDTRKSNSKKK